MLAGDSFKKFLGWEDLGGKQRIGNQVQIEFWDVEFWDVYDTIKTFADFQRIDIQDSVSC